MVMYTVHTHTHTHTHTHIYIYISKYEVDTACFIMVLCNASKIFTKLIQGECLLD